MSAAGGGASVEPSRHALNPTRCLLQVTAQVYEQPRHAFEGDAQPAPRHSESRLTAALGTMWAHAVNTRLVLETAAGVRYIKVSHCYLLAVTSILVDLGMNLGNPLTLTARPDTQAALRHITVSCCIS